MKRKIVFKPYMTRDIGKVTDSIISFCMENNIEIIKLQSGEWGDYTLLVNCNYKEAMALFQQMCKFDYDRIELKKKFFRGGK